LQQNYRVSERCWKLSTTTAFGNTLKLKPMSFRDAFVVALVAFRKTGTSVFIEAVLKKKKMIITGT
jgi:hypothetical protein